MAYNYEYPYTDPSRSNADWLLNKIKELSEKVDNFIIEDEIKFHDPIGWNITENYQKYEIVKNGDVAYLSKKPVPAGIDISNTDYWLSLGVFGVDGDIIRENIATNEGVTTRATQNLDKGAWLWLNGKFYEVTENIVVGDYYTEGVNIEKRTVEEIVKNAIEKEISDINHIRVYPNVNSMKNDLTLKASDFVYCRGYYNAEDGGSGCFFIKDTIDSNKFTHTLNNGLYAENTDNDFLLPRYGGLHVNEMMDNARPYMRQHQWKDIILPVAIEKHPGCDHYTEAGKENYFWTVTAPVLFDETLAYSNIFIYDQIICDKTATNLEAVFKVSDANKPEDIYFNTHVVISGYHFGGIVVEPEHALLIEGCARFNFQYLQCGFAKNCITLGGSGSNNTVDLFIDQLEFGSSSRRGIYATGQKTTSLHVNSMLYQRPTADNVKVIEATGNIYNWYIGNFAFGASGTSFAGIECFKFTDIGGNVLPEDTLYIGAARIGGATIGTFTGAGWVNIGKIIAGVSVNAPLTVGGLMRVTVGSLGARLSNNQIVIDTTGATDEAANVYIDNIYPVPTINGKNVVIGGICTNGSAVNKGRLINSILYDLNTNILKFRINGTDHTPV